MSGTALEGLSEPLQGSPFLEARLFARLRCHYGTAHQQVAR